MLTDLSIENIVLIKGLSLDVSGGLTALTGETGAGKSILLDSLGLVTGSRSEARLVRKGEDRAVVTARFIPPSSLKTILAAHDIAAEDELILKRVILNDGKSKAFINDQSVGVSLLKDIGDHLIEIHGQFETHGLLDPKTHRQILDDFGGLGELCRETAAGWHKWQHIKAEITAIKASLVKAAEEKDYLKNSVKDLEDLNPLEGEVEELEEKKKLLMSTEAILNAFQEVSHHISGQNRAEEYIYQACKALDKIADKAEDKVTPLIAKMDEALAALRDVTGEIETIAYDMSHMDDNLEYVDDRLHAYKAQARKHMCMPDQLLEKLGELQEQLNTIETQDARLDTLIKEEQSARQSYIASAESLSGARRKAALAFAAEVNAELPPLKLDKAEIFIELDRLEEPQWSGQGMDKISFTISTNPGQDPGPLNKIASGGELSRFMLAFKVVMAGTGGAGTMIFDEIDAGVGGATAAAIGERLSRLARSKQVLVVTHSPQVAASADQHWVISKSASADGGIITTVTPLSDPAARQSEIARMLAGTEITEEAQAAADKLLQTGKAA